MDLPGVKKEDMEIDLKEREITIIGKVEHVPHEARKYIEVEFGGGEYARSFTLSDVVDREKIKASMNNGVLELFLPQKRKKRSPSGLRFNRRREVSMNTSGRVSCTRCPPVLLPPPLCPTR